MWGEGTLVGLRGQEQHGGARPEFSGFSFRVLIFYRESQGKPSDSTAGAVGFENALDALGGGLTTNGPTLRSPQYVSSLPRVSKCWVGELHP